MGVLFLFCTSALILAKMIAPRQRILIDRRLLGRLVIICQLTIAAVSIISCNSQKKETTQMLIRHADSLINDSRANIKSFEELEQNIKLASELLKKAWLVDSSNYAVTQYQALTYMHMRKPDSVILSYSKWLKNHPDQLDPHLKRGLLYHKLNEESKAIADFSKVKTILQKRNKKIDKNLSPNELNPLITDSFTYFLIGEHQVALSTLLTINNVFPNNERVKNAIEKFPTLNREQEISKQIGF